MPEALRVTGARPRASCERRPRNARGSARLSRASQPRRISMLISTSKSSIMTHLKPFRRRSRYRAMRRAPADRILISVGRSFRCAGHGTTSDNGFAPIAPVVVSSSGHVRGSRAPRSRRTDCPEGRATSCGSQNRRIPPARSADQDVIGKDARDYDAHRAPPVANVNGIKHRGAVGLLGR